MPIVIALISFWYANIDAGRRERLEFVRRQIANLYGPLYSLIRTQKHLWEDLRKNSPKNITFLTEVALPLNRKIEETMLKSGEVIRCSAILKDLHAFFDFAESAVIVAESAKSSAAESAPLTAVKPTTDPKNNLKPYPRHFAAHLCKQLTVLKDWERKLDHPIKGLSFLPTVDDPDCKEVSAMPEDAKDTCDIN